MSTAVYSFEIARVNADGGWGDINALIPFWFALLHLLGFCTVLLARRGFRFGSGVEFLGFLLLVILFLVWHLKILRFCFVLWRWSQDLSGFRCFFSAAKSGKTCQWTVDFVNELSKTTSNLKHLH